MLHLAGQSAEMFLNQTQAVALHNFLQLQNAAQIDGN